MPSWGGAAAGAGTGAAIGSVVPVIGTALGAGVGALAGGLFGGGKKDAHQDAIGGDANGPLSPAELAKRLSASATTRSASAEKTSAEGDDALGAVNNYFKQLASGDSASLLASTAASRGRVIDQYDVARQNAANFSPRGGGTTAASAMSRVAEANQLSDLTSSAQTSAMDRLASLGIDLKQIGLGEEQLASADLNTLINAVLGQEQLNVQKRGQNAQTAGGLAEAAGTILGLYLTRQKKAA